MNLENQDYENILNTMPGTGVYVIREEDHGILYFNKKAKEASPEAALGVPCRDVWGGSCAGCPLETMEDRRESRSVGYHDSYGGVVDITAARTLWEGRTPAVVLTVTPRAEDGFACRKLLRLDLEGDACAVLKSDGEGWQPQDGPLSVQLEALAGSGGVHPGDRARLAAYICPEGLRAALREGETLLYRRRDAAGVRWNLMEVLPDPSGGNRFAFLCIRDVHGAPGEDPDSPEEQARPQSAYTRRDMQMAAILKSRFKMMNTVDLETGMCERVDLSRPAGPENTCSGDYSRYVQYALDRVVHPDDAGTYQEQLSLEHLRKKAETVEDFAEEVCLYRQLAGDEDPRWIELRVIYTRQQDGVTVNILGQDVTRAKCQEASRLQALEDRAAVISSLSSLFFSTYYINLEQDTFRAVVQMRRVGDILGEEVECSAAFQIYANHFIHPEDRQEYLRVMNTRNLRETLRWWNPCAAVEYRMAPGTPEEGRRVRATAVLARTRPDDIPMTVVYVAQDISGSRRTEGETHG